MPEQLPEDFDPNKLPKEFPGQEYTAKKAAIDSMLKKLGEPLLLLQTTQNGPHAFQTLAFVNAGYAEHVAECPECQKNLRDDFEKFYNSIVNAKANPDGQ